MNTTQEKPTMTAQELLDNLHQRIADGDTTVTADELQQAEASVNFTRLQTAGQHARAQAAEHQARLDELHDIRVALEVNLPEFSTKIRAKLAKAEKEIEAAEQLATEHNTQVTAFRSRIKQLERDRASVEGLELAGTRIIAGDREIDTINLDQDIARAANSKGSFPSSKLELVNEFRAGDRVKTNNSVTVRWLHDRTRSSLNVATNSFETVYDQKAGDTASLSPGAAQHLVEYGAAEYVD